MQVFRISKRRHAATAFSGEGARVRAARWNPAGVAMVYTSHSLSLAALEVFVHLDPAEEPSFVSIAAEIPVAEKDLLKQAKALVKRLPVDWHEVGHPVPREIGAEWARSGRSLALMVPSAIIDGEWNVLLNPLHRDASRILLGEAKPFGLIRGCSGSGKSLS